MKISARLTISTLFLLTTFPAFAQMQLQTQKPITKLPAKIEKSGNYYLSKNLTQTAAFPNATAAITIEANDVSLNLNGRILESTLQTDTGIAAFGFQRIRIFNGTIQGFDTGIFLSASGTGANRFEIERVTVSNCKQFGIYLDGENSFVRHCIVQQIGGGSAGNQNVEGIRIQKQNGAIEDCEIKRFTRDQANYTVTGIKIIPSGFCVRRNIVDSAMMSAAGTVGISITNGSSIFSENIVSNCAVGFQMSNDVYRDNATFNCTMKYSGGQDAGGNN